MRVYYHPLNNPTWVWWYENGQKSREEWRKNNHLHNLDGPAYIEWDENGVVVVEEYWVEGKRQSKREARGKHERDLLSEERILVKEIFKEEET